MKRTSLEIHDRAECGIACRGVNAVNQHLADPIMAGQRDGPMHPRRKPGPGERSRYRFGPFLPARQVQSPFFLVALCLGHF